MEPGMKDISIIENYGIFLWWLFVQNSNSFENFLMWFLGDWLNIKMWAESYQHENFHYKDKMVRDGLDGLMQDRRNSIANALEIRLSCTNSSVLSLQ